VKSQKKLQLKIYFLAVVGLGTGIRIRDTYSAKDLDPGIRIQRTGMQIRNTGTVDIFY